MDIANHEVAQTAWIYYLEEDYPDSGLYEQYSYLLDESVQRMLEKEFVAACPVDVYVYDGSDQLVASVVDGRVSCSGDVMIALIGDTKVVRFYDGQDDYHIEYIGTDTGEMDITISEFDNNEEIVRTVNFYDVELQDGMAYSINVGNEVLENSSYELIGPTSGLTIKSDYDSFLTDGETYTVSVQSGTLSRNGEISLSADASVNETIELNAYTPDGYTFIRWESSNGEDIFADDTSASTSFIMPDEDIVIKAVLQADDGTHIHVYADPEFTWSDDYASCTAVFTCEDGDDSQEVECVVTSADNSDGTVTYTATVEFNGTTYTDTRSSDGTDGGSSGSGGDGSTDAGAGDDTTGGSSGDNGSSSVIPDDTDKGNPADEGTSDDGSGSAAGGESSTSTDDGTTENSDDTSSDGSSQASGSDDEDDQSSDSSSSASSGDSVQTGDDTDIVIWGMLAVAAGSAMVFEIFATMSSDEFKKAKK